jgi:hypothetical protein
VLSVVLSIVLSVIVCRRGGRGRCLDPHRGRRVGRHAEQVNSAVVGGSALDWPPSLAPPTRRAVGRCAERREGRPSAVFLINRAGSVRFVALPLG